MSEQSNMPNTWNSANYGFEIKSNELNCGSPQIPSYFFNPSWDNSVDHNDPFESALSSMVSSPTVGLQPTGGSVGDGKTIVLSELIGKLGGISNNIGDISTHSSCYSTPLNSPPKLSSLSMVDHQIRGNFPIPYRNVPTSHQISVPFSPDLGFAERAARFSSFNGNRAFGPNGNESSHKLTPKLEPISQSSKIGGSQFGGKARSSSQDQKLAPEIVDSREGSSVSYQISGGESANARKRKSASKGKTKDSNHNHNPSSSSPPSKDAKMGEGHDESNGKRIKANEKEEANENKDNSKPPEPSTKDYIHVRARRGQATDSHSLAERVRREKISERMKFLQDLVPGCNKVTGKAVMLDEIINYVQSLQRQVEFLSMKLSTLNPRMELNLETILSKDIFQSRTTMAQNIYPFESAYGASMNGFSVESLNNALHQNTSLQAPPVESHADLASSQAATFWDDELHSIVKMGFGENLFQNSQY